MKFFLKNIKNLSLIIICLYSMNIGGYKVKISNLSKHVLPVRCVIKNGAEQKVVKVRPRKCHIFESKHINNLYLEGNSSVILDFQASNIEEVNFKISDDIYKGKWDIEKEYKHLPLKESSSSDSSTYFQHSRGYPSSSAVSYANYEEPYWVVGRERL